MDNYFFLPQNKQQELLYSAENKLGISAEAIEKDIWVCWLLKQLFELPQKMVFKGGTSLSKAFNLIDRFSEDIDITVDYQNFIHEIDLKNTSRSQFKRVREELNTKLKEHINSTVVPHLKRKILIELPEKKFQLELEGTEKLHFYYPSVLTNYLLTEDERPIMLEDESGYILLENSKYLLGYVLIEFGIRNTTEPQAQQPIETLLLYAINDNQELQLPQTKISVLSPIRTFWEKATLIHVACHHNNLSANPSRLSRHWYDLAKLANSWVREEALNQFEQLEYVIEVKNVFYYDKSYNQCTNGNFRLIPSEDGRKQLLKDYQQMNSAGMFSKEPPKLDQILQTLSELERQINQHYLRI